MRVWIIAQDHQLKTLVSNKKKLWKEIVERLEISEDNLNQKLDFLTVTTYPNWVDDEKMNLSNPQYKKFNKQDHLYKIFKDNKNVKVHKGEFENLSVTIWEREVK
jgi:hypothetical protein